MRVPKFDTQLLVGLLAVLVCVSAAGCGATAQLMYLIKGHDIPAAYSGFEGKRVAIVVTTESSSYGPDPLAETIERYLHLKLATNVHDIDIVSNTQVNNWLDLNDPDGTNLVDLGKGINADLVLGVDVENYKIRQGRTIYKGRADIEVNVVDIATGAKTFALGPDHFSYPENGRPAINTTDRQFQIFYLSWLTEKIARNFYEHDGATDYAEDAAFGG